MVLPDGTRVEEERPRVGRGILSGLAGMVLVTGVVVLGALTTPDPALVAEPTSTTSTSTTLDPLDRPLDLNNFTVGQIAVGQPLEWEQARDIANVFPIALVEQDGRIYLFASTADYWSAEPGALRAWRSDDGSRWEPLGDVLQAEHRIGSVIATDTGFMALAGDAEGSLTAWLSPDGIDWKQENIPVTADSEHVLVYPNTGASAGGVVVVSGFIEADVTAMLAERIAAVTGEEIDFTRLSWNTAYTSDGFLITVHGPLGLPILRVTNEELGLSEEEELYFTRGTGMGARGLVWTRIDGEWHQGELPDAEWIESIHPRPDGGFVALGSTISTPGAWTSADGLAWTLAPMSQHMNWTQPWREGWVGIRPDRSLGITVSADGTTWTDTRFPEYFPYQLGWYVWPLSAGEGGVAVQVEAHESSRGPMSAPEPVTISGDGTTLIVDLESSQFTLETGGVGYTFHGFTSTLPEWISVDAFEEVVKFHNQETGEELAVFTFEELWEAENQYWESTWLPENDHLVFAFSPDGETWTIQDLEAALGEEARIGNLIVTSDRVVATVARYPSPFGRMGEPVTEIWTAGLP